MPDPNSSHFNGAFSRWIDSQASTLTLREIADATGIDHSDLSRAKSGQRPFSRKNLHKLLPYVETRFDKGQAIRLLTSWMLDQIPSALRDQIEVRPTLPTILQESPTDPLEQLCARWLKRALTDKQFAQALGAMDAVYFPDQAGQ